jgi:PAS domain S-box-containing protein
MDPAVVGMVLVVAGASLALLTILLLRAVPQTEPQLPAPAAPPIPIEIASHADAVLLVQVGGRVVYMNPRAREWFRLGGEEPNLERMSRRTRPPQVFLDLCAAEGQCRFSLDYRYVEGVSYYVPFGNGRAMLVALRRPQLVVPAGSQAAPDTQAVNIFSELSRNMAASLELEPTLQAILTSLERLIPADFAEIAIWDEEEKHLIPYRFVGLPDVDRHLEKSSETHVSGMGYSSYLVNRREPLLVGDVDNFRITRPLVDRQRYPFRSYLGTPLLLAKELVGTLELASLAQDAFTQNDLELLRLLSGQAAIVLHNALAYKQEQQRATELAGLAQLAQAVSAQGEPQDLFSRLVESVVPLLQVELLGFWVYDEERRSLEAQVPFYGIQPNVIEWARVIVLPDSPAEKLVASQGTLIASDAPNDPHFQDLGVHHLAQASGMRHAVLVPLAAGGRFIGYLEAANKLDGSSFNADDLRILAIIAGQAAPIIENATLVEQSRRRAQRAETLRRIASLTSSSATLDEILMYSLLDLARLLQADVAAIFLVDESRGELKLHRASLFGVSPEAAARFSRLAVDDPQYHQTVTGSQRQFLSGNLADDPHVMPLYRPLIESLEIKSAIDVPLVVRQRGIGEVMLGSRKPEFFQHGDLLSAATAASQLAGAIEQATLSTQTDESLRRRVDQLTALTHISRELNTTLDHEYLLERVFKEALGTTRADCGSILMFEVDDRRQEAESQMQPKVVLQLGDRSSGELHPLERAVLEAGESLVVDDFDQYADPTTGEKVPPAHPDVRSALIVPIAYQEQVAGLIHLHGRNAFLFDKTAQEIAEALAIQAAIAIGNAHRYQEQKQRSELLNRRVETLARLNETSKSLELEQPLEVSLEHIAYAIQAATSFDVILISVYEAQTGELHRLCGAGLPLASLDELKAHPQAWSAVQQLLKPEFRVGNAYFIPHEQMPVMPPEIHTLTVLPLVGQEQPEAAWHPDDMLLVPLFDPQGQPLGLISVDAPRDGRRPDRPAIDALELFGSQAALVVAGRNKLASLQTQVERMHEDLALARQSSDLVQKQLPVLFHKDIEQTIALQRVGQKVRRTEAVLKISTALSQKMDRAAALELLGQELLNAFGFDLALVAEAGANGPQLAHILGPVPPQANPQALFGQQNPLHACLGSGEIILQADAASGEWGKSPLVQALAGRGLVCLPVRTEEGIEAAVLGLSLAPLPEPVQDNLPLYHLLARQAGVALENLNLIAETNRRLQEVDLLLDFSRQLGSLDQASILRTLVESALRVIPAAQAGMVALWDERQATLVPKSAAGYPHPDRFLDLTLAPEETLPGLVFTHRKALRLDEVDFARHYRFSAEKLLAYREATGGRFPVSGLLVPVTGSGEAEPIGVLMVENFSSAAAFTPEDQELLSSLAHQTALTLENTRLYHAAEERASQLQALTSVSATITASLQPDELVATLLEQLQAILPYDTGTLWLRQGSSEGSLRKLVVRAARGFPDSEERLGISANVEDSMLLLEMIDTGQPLYVGNVNQDPRFPSLVESQYLSWLGVPLIASGQVLGVIALEKAEPGFYTPEHLQIVQTFAGQAAVALENARLYQVSVSRAIELDERSQRLSMLNRLSVELGATLEPQTILGLTVSGLREGLDTTGVSAVLFDPDRRPILRAEAPQVSPALPVELPPAPLFDRLRQTRGILHTEDIARELDLTPLSAYLEALGAHSLLALSLSTGEDLHGVMIAYSGQPRRFTIDEVELARTICNQSAIALEKASLYAETRSLTEDLERRVTERTAQLGREHQRAEALLRIFSELSASLDLNHVLNRTLQVLNDIVDAQQIAALITRPGEERLYTLAAIGYHTAELNATGGSAAELRQTMAGWLISKRQSVLVPDLHEDERWVSLRGLLAGQRSFIGVPLMIGAEALGALLFYHPDRGHFTNDQLELVQAAANQVAVAVNNAELYRLIRDQAEDLGTMYRSQQVEASRSRAILEAVADGVLVTDASRVITLFNASAEKILDLQAEDVIGKSLEYFTGLFGGAAQTWMETIGAWSQDARAYQAGDVYVEQIHLEDGRVVSVHLAPVIGRGDFLGTVSIFQDITHQVEVDRLKSEFVATVSHELRTPMTSIKGYVEILLMGAAGALNEQQAHFLEVVKANTERLQVLVNDLLDISRIEAGKATLAIQPLDLGEIAHEAVNELERRTREDGKPMTIKLKVVPSLPLALGDKERVRQIFDNLLENAYQYTAEKGKISLRIHPSGKELQVDVEDNGIGIPPEQQDRVFERFFRGEHPFVLATSGTGLGLSIVKHLVEMHKGRIWLKSDGVPGRGSVFSFTLPAYEIKNE